MMFMVFLDLNDGAHHPIEGNRLHTCLMIKGVEFTPSREGEGIYKSACQPLDPNNLAGAFGNPADRFPQWECPTGSFSEGSPCLHFDADSTGQLQAVLPGRCVRPRSNSADVLATWGPGMRCIPLPHWLNR